MSPMTRSISILAAACGLALPALATAVWAQGTPKVFYASLVIADVRATVHRPRQ